MNCIEMQYNICLDGLFYFILFSYLLLFGFAICDYSAISIHEISNVIFFKHAKLYSSQNLSFGILLKIFLKFGTFQPQYSYKDYSYKKKKKRHSASHKN